MRAYPAVDIRSGELDLLYALLDDFAPTAIEERDEGVRAFFHTIDSRDAALGALSAQFDVSPLEVPDGDWARRSQEHLQPIAVGRITIVPSAHLRASSTAEPQDPGAIEIVIEPSMGFGTGHHATTRLCLAALQETDIAGKEILDVGTGSGVLAIAAERLGAASALGIDFDPDAIESAQRNLRLNPAVTRVRFAIADASDGVLPPADIVTANLTGALLVRTAPRLLDAARPSGVLILSGVLREERHDVLAAFGAGAIVWERQEDEWVGFVVKKR